MHLVQKSTVQKNYRSNVNKSWYLSRYLRFSKQLIYDLQRMHRWLVEILKFHESSKSTWAEGTRALWNRICPRAIILCSSNQKNILFDLLTFNKVKYLTIYQCNGYFVVNNASIYWPIHKVFRMEATIQSDLLDNTIYQTKYRS